MSNFKMTDYEMLDKYVYDTIEELIATDGSGLVKKGGWVSFKSSKNFNEILSHVLTVIFLKKWFWTESV